VGEEVGKLFIEWGIPEPKIKPEDGGVTAVDEDLGYRTEGSNTRNITLPYGAIKVVVVA
jgi:hypothetical protein